MRRYWNEVAGPRWVQRAEIQEARNIEVAQILLREANARPGERVLDIGCGPGATALPLATSVGPSGHVTGVDISELMLGLLRQRVAERGVTNLTPLLADAQTYAFEPASFDLLTSRFGVMFFADHLAAFTNLGKALRPGGRLCIAVWAGIEDNMHWQIPFEIAVRHVGQPKPQPPNAPGPMAMRDPDYVRRVLGGAGFTDIAIKPTRFHVIGKSAASEAEHAGALGPSGRLLDEKDADEATRRAVIKETEAAFLASAGAVQGEIRLPGTFLLLRARRPA
ncbi:MAG: methyltransferase domain-containing protein [Alphaproteobacteria bacterium]|nr:methyltransferase domain-containing protein [Alphaproteobacteria bacterium]